MPAASARPPAGGVTAYPFAGSVGEAYCDLKIECLSPPSAPDYGPGRVPVVRYYDGEELGLPAPALSGSEPLSFSAEPDLPPGLELRPDGSIAGRVAAAAPVFHAHFIIKVRVCLSLAESLARAQYRGKPTWYRGKRAGPGLPRAAEGHRTEASRLVRHIDPTPRRAVRGRHGEADK